MTRKSITTSHAAVACDVCGRTLLRGENSDVFLAGGSRRTVCELCTARATHEGWIREGLDLSAGTRRTREGRRSLFSRLGRRRDNGHEELEPGGAEDLLPLEPEPVEHLPEPEPAPAVAPEPVYEPPREPRHVHAVPTNADLKMQRALEVFNTSDHTRTVGGVARSLGARGGAAGLGLLGPAWAVVGYITRRAVAAVRSRSWGTSASTGSSTPSRAPCSRQAAVDAVAASMLALPDRYLPERAANTPRRYPR